MYLYYPSLNRIGHDSAIQHLNRIAELFVIYLT